MIKNTDQSSDKLADRLEMAEHMTKLVQKQFDELAVTARKLRNSNDKLKEERDGWKRATSRNGIAGFVLGAMIFIWIGYVVGFFIAQG